MTTLEEKFCEYKAMYSKQLEKQDELIASMQENLKKRTLKSDVTVMDGTTLSVDSREVTELYKIDAALRQENVLKDTCDLSEEMTSRNKYTKDHPYKG